MAKFIDATLLRLTGIMLIPVCVMSGFIAFALYRQSGAIRCGWMKRKRSLFKFLAVLAFTGSSQLHTTQAAQADSPPIHTPQQPKNAEKADAVPKGQQLPTFSFPPSINVTISGKLETSREGKQSDAAKEEHEWLANFFNAKITDWIVAAFTVFIAAFTFGLWCATIRLWRSTEKLWLAARKQARDMYRAMKAAECSAEVAERSHLLLERPYIFVTGVIGFTVDRTISKGAHPHITYNLINYGKAPGFIEGIWAHISGPHAASPVHPVFSGNVPSILNSPIIAPGENESGVWEDAPDTLKFKGTKDEVGDCIPHIQPGDWLYFWVVIKYRGSFSNGHESSFCWIYNHDLFVPFGGAEYNYVK